MSSKVRSRIIESLYLLCVPLLFLIIDFGIWVTSAYSLVASLLLITLVHLSILVPAILLPIVWKRLQSFIYKQRRLGRFHKYDWNIIWSYTTVISFVVVLLLVLYSTPLWFRWMNEPIFVQRNATFTDVQKGVSFIFSKEWTINMSMMGSRKSVPVGEPANTPEYWECFAPIFPKNKLEPNMFWAYCSGLKQNCSESIKQNVTCFSKWMDKEINTALAVSPDIEYSVRSEITKTGTKYGLPSPPPYYLVVHWDNLGKIYNTAQLVWLLSICIGNGLIIIWIIVRRFVLEKCCGHFDDKYINIG